MQYKGKEIWVLHKLRRHGKGKSRGEWVGIWGEDEERMEEVYGERDGGTEVCACV
jgi:hypothetical protein